MYVAEGDSLRLHPLRLLRVAGPTRATTSTAARAGAPSRRPGRPRPGARNGQVAQVVVGREAPPERHGRRRAPGGGPSTRALRVPGPVGRPPRCSRSVRPGPGHVSFSTACTRGPRSPGPGTWARRVGRGVGRHGQHLRPGPHRRPAAAAVEHLEGDEDADRSGRGFHEPVAVAGHGVERHGGQAGQVEEAAERDVLAEGDPVHLLEGRHDPPVGPQATISLRNSVVETGSVTPAAPGGVQPPGEGGQGGAPGGTAEGPGRAMTSSGQTTSEGGRSGPSPPEAASWAPNTTGGAPRAWRGAAPPAALHGGDREERRAGPPSGAKVAPSEIVSTSRREWQARATTRFAPGPAAGEPERPGPRGGPPASRSGAGGTDHRGRRRWPTPAVSRSGPPRRACAEEGPVGLAQEDAADRRPPKGQAMRTASSSVKAPTNAGARTGHGG